MNTVAWQLSRTAPECGDASLNLETTTAQRQEWSLQGLIVVAVAVALRRGEVAILVIVVLDRRGRRLFFLAVILSGKLFAFAGSVHVIALIGKIDLLPHLRRRIDLNLTPLTGMLTAVEQSFLPFSIVQCKPRRNKTMIRKSIPSGYDPIGGSRFSEKIMLKQGDEIMIRFKVMIQEPK
jgi:hypothetical protein